MIQLRFFFESAKHTNTHICIYLYLSIATPIIFCYSLQLLPSAKPLLLPLLIMSCSSPPTHSSLAFVAVTTTVFN